jgi:hypothetical protein
VGRESSSGPIFLQRTLQLLRSNRRLVERNDKGALTVGSEHYSPTHAVVGVRVPTHDTTGNRRITLLLKESLAMAHQLAVVLPKPQRGQVRSLATEIESTLSLFPFRRLINCAELVGQSPSQEEIADPRYRQAYDIYQQLLGGLGWLPGTKATARFAYVAYADSIYQIFAALALARAFELAQTRPSVESKLSDPLFASDRYALYYDTSPPKELFQNWRDLSARPADMRPDLALIDIRNNRGLLLDVKYRVESTGIPPTSAINECQIYMHSYSQKNAAVCYPGPELKITSVEGNGNRVLQIAVAPLPGLLTYLRNEVRPLLERVMGEAL